MKEMIVIVNLTWLVHLAMRLVQMGKLKRNAPASF